MSNVLNKITMKQRLNKARNLSMTLKKSGEALEAIELKKKAKDDWDSLKNVDQNFLNNNYWKVPSQYNIDDLIKENQ